MSLRSAMLAAALCVSLVAGRTHAVTQITLAIDASNSIDATEFAVLQIGIADAIRQLRTDSAVELTVIQFGSEAARIVNPTLVDSAATRSSIADQVQFAIQRFDVDTFNLFGGDTNYEAAIDLAASKMVNSSSFVATDLQIINIATDGEPNISTSGNDPVADALASVNDAVQSGIDLVSFEAIGFGSPPALLDQLAYPQPVQSGPLVPIETAGFVIDVEEVGGVFDAMITKFDAAGVLEGLTPSDGVIPEPLTAGLGLVGLLGVAHAATRRR